MLNIERLTDRSGRELAGFFVRNAAGKALAIGAFAGVNGFVMPTHKRYARDLSLCEALGRITCLPVKWNLSYYGRHVTSGSNQELMAMVRRARRLA